MPADTGLGERPLEPPLWVVAAVSQRPVSQYETPADDGGRGGGSLALALKRAG